MQTPRRFLPSIGLLSAFEAAARTGSFTAASRELDLTQSAISRQIRALEDQLGVSLFIRERQTVRLSLAGETYARDIRDALRRISAASLALRANPSGGTLNLGILPTFGARWLAPRLPDFLARHAGITVNLATRPTEFDFRLDTIDAAIHFGAPTWPGTLAMPLMQEAVAPMASPDFAVHHAAGHTPQALKDVPLLHLTSRPDAWEQWFAAHSVDVDAVTGMLFDQFSAMAEGAMAGLGVALLPTFLFARETAAGSLVPLIDVATPSAGRYHLVWPRERDAYPPLVAFRKWLSTCVSADGAPTG